ncbi:hypothetical protein Q428_14305 [Fervidicella metallireducens AeB]|uniref:ABC3 transporter permease protein domain-containing protein n=1 Tax=Fervidicella metallireducens AeB TaxID=1403537 RepID=A0A017RR59_9CLOT|nr:ABC transporter permease [Fervidicella metallireducens]EYE87253.1 hypothetical protein Q428_14305 [Fervidicella metallireducens AeB]
MNFLKRAFLSVTKRKAKSIILILVLGLIANLVLAGLSIQTATKKSGELARKKLGGTVILQADMRKYMQSLRESGYSEEKRPEAPQLSIEDANKLIKLNHVSGYNYISSALVEADDFKPVDVETAQSNDNSNNNRRWMRMGMGEGQNMANANISLSGALFSGLLTEFTEGTNKLIEGRHFTDEDRDKNVAIVEKNLVEKNSLKIGDKIKIKSLDGKQNILFKIIGIYEANTNNVNNMGMNLSFMSPYNKIYVPYITASKLKVSNMVTTSTNTIESAIYYIDDPINVENFKNEALKANIDFTKFKLDANDSLYKQMMGPIENVASFSKTIVYIITLAGAAILALIIILSLRDRKYEIGVLLSMGESRIKIIGQLVVETLIITCIAFTISTFTGKVVAQELGDILLKNEIKVSQTLEDQEVFGRQQGLRVGPGGIVRNLKVEPVDEFDVSVTAKDMKKLSLIGILIVFIATFLPAISILRFNPKTILTRNE